MKKLLLVILIIGIYLNWSYTYFYNFLSKNYLVPPIHETQMMVSNQSGSQTIKYLALGDSLTAGVGVADYKNSYPYLIAQKLSSKNKIELINLAHAGNTSADVLANQLPKTLSLKPDLITILIGVNDIHNLTSLKEFEDNYTRILATLKKSGAKIYVLSIPYLGSEKIVYFPYNFILNFRTKQFNNVIKKITNQFEVEYTDLYLLKKPDKFYSSDEFHPSDKGYGQWSEIINVN